MRLVPSSSTLSFVFKRFFLQKAGLPKTDRHNQILYKKAFALHFCKSLHPHCINIARDKAYMRVYVHQTATPDHRLRQSL
jgi:hypothetical protein